jgi:hypothetical protein
VIALVDEPVMIENERKGDSWVGVLKGCTKTAVMIHSFNLMGGGGDDVDHVPFRSIAQRHGTTEHTEHTEARDNGGRIRFRVFGVFCGSKRKGIATEAYR